MADRPVETRYHDEVDPDSREGYDIPVIPIIGAILLIATPLTLLSAFASYLAFAKLKIRMSVIFWFGLVPYLIGFAIFNEKAIELFSTSWRVTIPGIVEKTIPASSGVFQLLIQQAPISIPLGIIIGLGWAAYRWRTRPAWLAEPEFRLTPFEFYRKKKNIKDIKADKNSPYDGMTLGISKHEGKKIVQTYEESRAHTLVLGASGSGKTTTLMSRLRDSIKAGQGLVFIDLKGGPDIPDAVSKLATRYGKELIHWTMQPKGVPYDGPAKDGPAYYDPIARGEATRRKDLLIESREWSEDYYKIEASSYLQKLFAVLVETPQKGISTLSDVVQLLNPKYLQERAIPLGARAEYQDIVRSIDHLNDEKLDRGKAAAINGLGSQLETLLHSIAGPYLQLDPKGNNNINLREAAHKGDIIVFSLDSSNYGELASLVANLIIQDLKTVSSELRNDKADRDYKPFQVVIDEFQAIDSSNIIGFINKSRDAKMPVTLATQTLGDLRAVKDNPAFLDQLLGIVNSFIIHKTNQVNDAKIFAGLTGTVIRKKFNESVKYSTGLINRGAASGQGSIQDVEETTIMPDQIQRLKQGEFIYVNLAANKIMQILCIPEEEDKVVEAKKITLDKKEVPVFDNEPISMDTSAPSFPIPPTVNLNALHNPPAPSANTKHFAPIGSDIPMPGREAPYNTKVEEAEKGITIKPANRDRLKEIFNQSPDDFLPVIDKKDDFTVSHMPPKVSPPLNNTKLSDKAISSKQPLPALPSLPALPNLSKPPVKKPAVNGFPQLPQLSPPPVQEEKKNETNTKTGKAKDEFDF